MCEPIPCGPHSSHLKSAPFRYEKGINPYSSVGKVTAAIRETFAGPGSKPHERGYFRLHSFTLSHTGSWPSYLSHTASDNTVRTEQVTIFLIYFTNSIEKGDL